MRCRAFFVSVILIAAASAPAAAQIKLDMNKITCGNWLGYGSQDPVPFVFDGSSNVSPDAKVPRLRVAWAWLLRKNDLSEGLGCCPGSLRARRDD
jgi:hypothetical protein